LPLGGGGLRLDLKGPGIEVGFLTAFARRLHGWCRVSRPSEMAVLESLLSNISIF
jgi:hypothetical protein